MPLAHSPIVIQTRLKLTAFQAVSLDLEIELKNGDQSKKYRLETKEPRKSRVVDRESAKIDSEAEAHGE